jgi:hypothetical protein
MVKIKNQINIEKLFQEFYINEELDLSEKEIEDEHLKELGRLIQKKNIKKLDLSCKKKLYK